MESVGASPQSIWSIKVESNGLADGEMRGERPSCRAALEVMYSSADRARRCMDAFLRSSADKQQEAFLWGEGTQSQTKLQRVNCKGLV